jgi:hypothetical protein
MIMTNDGEEAKGIGVTGITLRYCYVIQWNEARNV